MCIWGEVGGGCFFSRMSPKNSVLKQYSPYINKCVILELFYPITLQSGSFDQLKDFSGLDDLGTFFRTVVKGNKDPLCP